MVERANFGSGEASMACERSCDRVLEVARERRRRLDGSEEVILEDRVLCVTVGLILMELVLWGDCVWRSVR